VERRDGQWNAPKMGDDGEDSVAIWTRRIAPVSFETNARMTRARDGAAIAAPMLLPR